MPENIPVILGGFLLHVLSTSVGFLICFFDVCKLLLLWKKLGQAASSRFKDLNFSQRQLALASFYCKMILDGIKQLEIIPCERYEIIGKKIFRIGYLADFLHDQTNKRRCSSILNRLFLWKRCMGSLLLVTLAVDYFNWLI